MQDLTSSTTFDGTFESPTPFLYFHHIVDPEEASLQVEVLGPNLAYKLHHSKMKTSLSPSEISERLGAKTVGFLALVAGNGRRIVLAWAESGHGHGLQGDTLDATPGVLENKTWTQRVMSLARQLGVSLRHTYDGKLAKLLGYEVAGVYNASHVEVKLAVHAVHVLLRVFDIKHHDGDKISRGDLRRLREARWGDGSAPVFEVYFSRAPCHQCLKIVSRLESMTGIGIRLLWRQRLVPIVYKKNAAMEKPPPLRSDITPTHIPLQDEDAMTLNSLDLIGEKEANRPAKRTKVHKIPTAQLDITKPLPATPVMEAPWWMTGQGPPTQDEGPTAENLPTPPSSGIKPSDPSQQTYNYSPLSRLHTCPRSAAQEDELHQPTSIEIPALRRRNSKRSRVVWRREIGLFPLID